ncbi:C2H2 finger domain-containing protein [Rutstroemia sp. NJR-2017a WRK4]|nr:C2H2 finger domain-containing protein [Rutstroemia sp. NJR-2017a WRK4]
MGGWSMDRRMNYSDQSNASSQSYSSGTVYTPLSSSPSMSYDYESPQQSQPSYQDEADYTPTTYDNYTTRPSTYEQSAPIQQSIVKWTPLSLGWTPNTDLWKLYKFIVPKGKEPYLELLPGLVVYDNTPSRVFLDPPSNVPKGVYPCQFPVRCPGKRFGRPADLERHYRQVHADADQKSSFPCDYPPCTRHTDPFTRKDHYRDHLKDFHKEDMGSAKQGKNARDTRKWQEAQQAWLEERRMDLRWWRCKKCLLRVYVKTDGYRCGTCNEDCAVERIEARERRRRAQEQTQAQSTQYASVSEASSSTAYADANPNAEEQKTCNLCVGMWIENEDGSSYPCPVCAPQTQSYEVDAGSGTRWSTYESGY